MPERRIVGAHELGDYVYCERAWWYDHHSPPDVRGGVNSSRSWVQGVAFHEQLMASHVRAQRTSRAYYAAAALLALGLLGLVLWEYHLFPFSWPRPW